MKQLLSLEDIAFAYDSNRARFLLKLKSFSLFSGEVCYLFGPSGCGKTTFLDIVAGILKPIEGVRRTVYNNNTLCYVMQKNTLLPWLSVKANIHLEAKFRNRVMEDRLINKWISVVDLAPPDLEKKPSQLSGGMKCRADLLRALCMEPSILLMDEAFVNMDYNRRLNVFRSLGPLISNGMSILACSHDVNEVLTMADRVLVFSPHNSIQKLNEVIIETPRKYRDITWYDSKAGIEIREFLGWKFEPVK